MLWIVVVLIAFVDAAPDALPDVAIDALAQSEKAPVPDIPQSTARQASVKLPGCPGGTCLALTSERSAPERIAGETARKPPRTEWRRPRLFGRR